TSSIFKFFTIGAYRFARSDTKGIIANQRQVAVPACTATPNNPSHRHIGQCRLSRCFLNVTFEHMELFSPDRPDSQKTGQVLHPLGKVRLFLHLFEPSFELKVGEGKAVGKVLFAFSAAGVVIHAVRVSESVLGERL
ncbi:hypothetical protein TNIN_244761, partial [Trichonephila inaurata madagascariensis]